MTATWEQFDRAWVLDQTVERTLSSAKFIGCRSARLPSSSLAKSEPIAISSPRSMRSNFVFPGQIPGSLLFNLCTFGRTSYQGRQWPFGRMLPPQLPAWLRTFKKGSPGNPLLHNAPAIKRPARREIAAGSDGRPRLRFTPYVCQRSAPAVASSLQIIGASCLGTHAGQDHASAMLTLRIVPLCEAVAKISAQIAGAGKSKPNVVPLPKRGGAA